MAGSKTTRRVALAIVGLAPLLAACTGILGISDFHKEECNGGDNTCLDSGSNTFDQFAPDTGGRDATDDGPITFVDGGGTEPVAWARWAMPNYPDAAVNVPTYDNVAGDAGALKDSISTLVWRPVGDNEKTDYTFKDATALCASLRGGVWRLPTRIELVTLLDFSQPSVKASPKFKLSAKRYWTTSFQRLANGPSSAAIQTKQRLAVGFDGAPDNVISAVDETTGLGAICIQAQ